MNGHHFGLTRTALLVGVLVVTGLNARADPGDTAGTVSRIQGAAMAIQDALPRPLEEGDPVFLGDILSTGKEARLEIRMIDEGVFTLGERTSFVVVDYSFGGATTDGGGAAVTRLLEGAVMAVSGTLAKTAAGGARVETEFATLGIRGTTFWAGVMEDGQLHVALWSDGKVAVENQAGRTELTEKGLGTVIAGATAAPGTAKVWGEAKTAKARAMIRFQ